MHPISRPTLLAIALCTASTLFAELQTWTNLDGQTMEAEFLGRKGNLVSFKKADGGKHLYAYEKLVEADRARIDALTEKQPEPRQETPLAAPAQTASAPSGELAAALAGKLMIVKGKSLVSWPREKIENARFLAIYYSAHWCPPCRSFTPELVAAYKEIKAKHPEFEVVFVSSDKDAEAMKDYMTEYGMEWPALRFDSKKTTRAVSRPNHERGIPNLVFMDANGKELAVSYTPEGKYLGPRAVLKEIKNHFKMP